MRGGDEGANFCFGEDARGLLGGGEDAINDVCWRGQAAALEPENHVGAAAHGANLDHLFEAEVVRWDAAVNEIGEQGIVFLKVLDDGGGVHGGGGTECVGAADGIIQGSR